LFALQPLRFQRDPVSNISPSFDDAGLESSNLMVSFKAAGLRCEYRWVIAISPCPTSSCTALMAAPRITKCEQKV